MKESAVPASRSRWIVMLLFTESDMLLATMTPEQIRELLKIIRDQFRLRAEVLTLAAILETAEQANQPPFGWLKALKLARMEQGYRNISEQFEPQFAEIERSLEATELDRLLKTIPPTQFLN